MTWNSIRCHFLKRIKYFLKNELRFLNLSFFKIKMLSENNLQFICIGDPHFKISNTQHSAEFVTKLLTYITQNLAKIDFIVVLGDVHDRFQNIHAAVHSAVSDFFTQLCQTGKPVYLIVGNHDRINNNDFLTDIHPFNDMKQWLKPYDITVVDKVVVREINGYKIVFVPYVYPGRFMEALQTVPESLSKTAVIFAHQEFRNVPMGAVKSIQGDLWPKHYPWVISGHIHDYWFNNYNIKYTGTPMQHSFGDKANKTISHFTLYPEFEEGNSSNNISSNLNDNSTNNNNNQENVQNNQSIRKYKLEEERIDLGLTKREIVRIAADKIHLFAPNPNKLQKVIIVGTRGQIKAVQQWDYIRELERMVAKVDYDPIDDDLTFEDISEEELLNGAKSTYLEDLFFRVQNNKLQITLLEKLFGTLDDNTNSTSTTDSTYTSNTNSTSTSDPISNSNSTSNTTSTSTTTSTYNTNSTSTSNPTVTPTITPTSNSNTNPNSTPNINTIKIKPSIKIKIK